MKLPFINTKSIRLIELFGGIGSQAMALTRLGVDFEHYRLVEFDKYSVKSYNAIHGTAFEPTDITKIHGSDLGIVDTDRYCYLITYSFPCQDLSSAGKQKGMSKGSGTRSGLLWEVERLLNETEHLPQLLLMENVPQVHSSKNMADFENWIQFLESRGYSNYWQDLNAKDYGVAQNRNRCFMVSILGDYCFYFPTPRKLDKVMKDYLEDSVDEKYYISSDKSKALIDKLLSDTRFRERECVDLSLNDHERMEIKTAFPQEQTEELATENRKEPELSNMITAALNYRRIDKVGLHVAKTLCASDYKGFGTGFQTMNGVIEWKPLIIENPKPKLVGGLGEINFGKQYRQGNRVYDSKSVAMCLTAQPLGNAGGNSYLYLTDESTEIQKPSLRIRKLTPKEWYRLMGFDDEAFERAEQVNSNTQLYKQAGNSIVVDVLMAIFDNLLVHSRSVWLDELLKDEEDNKHEND